MYHKLIFGFLLLLKHINNYYVLKFNTIFILDDSLQENQNFYNYLFQNELYTNLSIGFPPKDVKSLIKFESKGFFIYQGAFNYTLSSTANKKYWPIEKWFYNSIAYKISDYFYFNCSDISNKNVKSNIYKTNQTIFVVINKPKDNINKNYINYGIIGLSYYDKGSNESPESYYSFINTATKMWNLKNQVFYIEFNKCNYTYKNFFNNYHEGNLILGKELAEEEKEKDKIKYTYLLKDKSSRKFIINFDNIFTKINNNDNNNTLKFNSNKIGAELIVNMPYIVGTNEYLYYINNTFFSDLIMLKICNFKMKNDTKNKKGLYSFICNGKSDYLMNSLKTKFPELIFESIDLGKNFSLNIYDLFSYNNYNISDTNIYFLIFFNKKEKYENENWILGVPFFKKYTLSFDYENKKIGYYYKNQENKEEEKNNNINIIFRIFALVFIIVIIFILGRIYQKKMIKIPRKNKANELNDNYEYNTNSSKDINKNKDVNNKNVELGFGLFDY